MRHQIEKLTEFIKAVPEEFKQLSEQEYYERPAPNKWSKKEILGHLCDSAVVNQRRFIAAQIASQPAPMGDYNQDEWVRLQGYQDTPVDDIIEYWVSLNKTIIRTISNIPSQHYENLLKTEGGSTVTLQFAVRDYVEHMEHHLEQIFPSQF
ncbi:DinB family protein [Halobacillus hunanensis]|uniref:DinB family protein n=1 Tax=Halobacillus hunanensis TaxID=578214 RepID=UPI001590EB30|nr:DinB family protein [Halobacillus hunanensis]